MDLLFFPFEAIAGIITLLFLLAIYFIVALCIWKIIRRFLTSVVREEVKKEKSS